MQTEITNLTQSQVEQEQREFIVNVYKWMSMGLFPITYRDPNS